MEKCPSCHGFGSTYMLPSILEGGIQVPCPLCEGTGKVLSPIDLEDKLQEALKEHLGFNLPDGTYLYNLLRDKSAFGVGTMTMDDFVEVDLTFVDDLVEEIIKVIKEGNPNG